MVGVDMSDKFLVRGGRQLSGNLRPSGNKNAALPMIAATLMAEQPSQLTNVPRIPDVNYLLALITELGAKS